MCNEVKLCTELEWPNQAESLKAAIKENPKERASALFPPRD